MTQCRFQKERLRLLRAEQPGVGKERGQRGDVTAFPVRVPADRPSRPPRGVPGASLGRRGELSYVCRSGGLAERTGARGRGHCSRRACSAPEPGEKSYIDRPASPFRPTPGASAVTPPQGPGNDRPLKGTHSRQTPKPAARPGTDG